MLNVLIAHRCSNYYKWPLIVASDSAYVRDTMNIYKKDWQWYNVVGTHDMAIINKGNEVSHGDLWEKIIIEFDQLQVHVVHVRRMFTNGADALAKMKLSALKQKNVKGVAIAQVTTRAQARRMQQHDNDYGRSLANRVIDLDNEAAEYDEDELVVMLSDGDEEEEETALELQGVPDIREAPEEQIEEDPFILRNRDESIRLPPWSKLIAPATTNRKKVPASIRLEGPMIMDLANLMALLRSQQEADPEINIIIKHLEGEDVPVPMELDRQLHRYALEPISKVITYHSGRHARRFLVPAALQVSVIELFHK